MARLVPLALTAMFCASGAAAQCADWQNVSPGPRPPNRPSPVMTFDSGRNVTVAVFSYRSDADDLTDMYEYDGATWVHRLSGSLDGPRFGYSLTYDSLRAKTVFFGGYKGIGGGAQSTNTLALWDGTTMQVVGAAGVWPPVNGKARAAFDPVRGRTIIICDEPASDLWQTWEWTGSLWEHGPSFGPISTTPTEMVFDTRRNRAFVYTTGVSDVFEQAWEYQPGPTAAQGVWQRRTIAGSAFQGQTGSSLVYDSFRGRILRFGGKAQGGSPWAFNNGTWWWNDFASKWEYQLQYPHQPGIRGAAGIAFDSRRDRVVLFGGVQIYLDGDGVGSVRYYDDTWELYDNAPGFLTVPSNLAVDGGRTAIFAAATVGEIGTLQWFHDGNPIAGANGTVLAVNGAAAADAGFYWLQSSNACGVLNTPGAYLTVRPPVNNSYLSPSPIYQATIAGTTLGATADGTATCGNSNGSPDVWHTYTAPVTGTFTIDTCGSDFDTVLSISTCCPGPGSPVACNDDAPTPGACGIRTSTLSFPVTQGQQFLVRIGGYQGAAGNYTLNTRVVPFNNTCASATAVLAGTFAGSTVGATVDGSASCGTSNTTPDIWYRFRSDCFGTLLINTAGSSFDTVLSVQPACFGTELACNDDASLAVRYSAVSLSIGPGDHYIRVSGFNGATGTVVLNLTPPPPPSDVCTGAPVIGIGQRTFATRCAATSTLALPPACEQASGGVPFHDVWYRYIAIAPGMLELRLCDTTFSPTLAVYGGSCPTSPYDAFICVAREDSCGDEPLATLPTLTGEEYLIRVGGYYGLNAALAGSGTLDVGLVPFEPGACCLIGGGCSLLTVATCAGQVGTFRGEGTTCVACPSLAGACCVGTACVIADATVCAGGGGAFHGSGSICLESPQNPLTCCPVNFNRQSGVTVQDIFDFINAFFAADLAADFDRSESVTVQDIFDFLTAYFVGCS